MSNNERNLNEDHILEFQEAFNSFDPDKSGHVATKELGNLLRYLGINPTKEELQDLTIQIDPHCSGHLLLPDLLDMMSRIIMERNYDAQIEDAFRL
ncbi:calmodulin [Eurytemora carolleeae]|uniref:calmodulin n=1 Tax=Eurytemora carolleeae TaxID=1294199 RepID=UPI000C761F3E|nr:calmodulin [Eurytemora carolleeae]|eukprot:XP_023334052.1 calmodulin-like [Eurytemora affinis]